MHFGEIDKTEACVCNYILNKMHLFLIMCSKKEYIYRKFRSLIIKNTVKNCCKSGAFSLGYYSTCRCNTV